MLIIHNSLELENEVYLDLSAVFSTLQIKSAAWQMPEKCLFSSDAPMSDPDIYIYMIERTIQDKSVVRGILGENIQRVLGV